MIKSNGISSFIFSSSFKTFCTRVLRKEYDDQQAAAASLAHVADHHGSCLMGSSVRLWNFLDDDSLSSTTIYIHNFPADAWPVGGQMLQFILICRSRHIYPASCRDQAIVANLLDAAAAGSWLGDVYPTCTFFLKFMVSWRRTTTLGTREAMCLKGISQD